MVVIFGEKKIGVCVIQMSFTYMHIPVLLLLYQNIIELNATYYMYIKLHAYLFYIW